MASQQYQVNPFVGQQPLERMAGELAFLHGAEATRLPDAMDSHSLNGRNRRRMQAYHRLEALREKMASLKIEVGDINTEMDAAMQEKYGD